MDRLFGYICSPIVTVSVIAQMKTIVVSYLIIINLIAFVLYGIDKNRSIRNEYRISERLLLWMARLGGGIGCWLGIKIFRHKTKHTKFRFIVPLWMIIWGLMDILQDKIFWDARKYLSLRRLSMIW
jgi:uncharacterized membrane protein YsdA (DUF1294 family)